MPAPCPSCKQPLGLDLHFIIKNPVMQCPHCKTVMKWDVNKDIQKELNGVLNELQDIKKKYKGIATFG